MIKQPLRLQILLLLLLFHSPSYAEGFTSAFGQKFVQIPAGEFIMGNEDFELLLKEVKPEKKDHLKKELPAHKVKISRPFFLATTEVTQKMWKTLMDDEPGRERRWLRHDWQRLPVSRVSWKDVQAFIELINQADDEYVYRLPTEAEWEYAARAGTSGLRPFAYEDMAKYAWYRASSKNKPMPVGTLEPNAFGLYDMIGNLWEWVADTFDREYYKVSPEVDPKGPPTSIRKVMRGGSYHCTPERVRVGIRGSYVDFRSLSVLGFRLAADKKPSKNL